MKRQGLCWFDPEETDTSCCSLWFLSRTNILMGVSCLPVGIEAPDLTSLLEQFEETQGEFALSSVFLEDVCNFCSFSCS